MFYVFNYDDDSRRVFDSESDELCSDISKDDDFDDNFPISFSLRTFLYKVVKWIKNYYKVLKT